MNFKKMSLFLIMFVMFGCAAKRQMVKSEQNATATPPAAPVQKEEQSSRFADWQKVPDLGTVYFDFDKSELLPVSRDILKANAEYLKSNDNFDILVEGNCDERGTIAYNLALGDRRASVVREYYALLGVPVKRIAVISYGSEKPVDPEHNDAAWQKNRRAETKIRNAK